MYAKITHIEYRPPLEFSMRYLYYCCSLSLLSNGAAGVASSWLLSMGDFLILSLRENDPYLLVWRAKAKILSGNKAWGGLRLIPSFHLLL